jgi:chitinase
MSRLRYGIAAGVAVIALVVVGIVVTTRDDGPARAPDRAGPTRLVGYFAQWGVYARDYQVRDVQVSGTAGRLTHLLYAFGSTAQGRCAVGDPQADHERIVTAENSVDGVADTAATPLRGNFGQLRKLKAVHPELKILWSFGGWNGSAGFTDAARDPTAFAESCRRLLNDPRWAGTFDGIDLDWEYPNACGLQCDSSGRDAPARLAAAMRAALGPASLVTAAITADGGKLATADYASMTTHLDWVMPMTYDYFGTGSSPGPTAPHSALTTYPGIPRAGAAAETAISHLLDGGVPAGKILLGVGFYGRGWTGVSQTAPGGTAGGPAPGTYEPGIEDYDRLRKRCPPTGTVGGTAYARCGDQWWSYDTPETLRTKAAYARDRGLGGAFVWELSGDTPEAALLTALASGFSPR